ncbi:PTS beta-glucoside transporter subunit EIIBCA [Clostridium sp. MCC353]|uniref:beta-glucoside-specific PTS transporter subunit IIABC n=1 Tax=Clostridium sp. MCC353 TaxID=2592646 RepID=UPI001C02912B|nr:beta-glucoside-specific PTS transporter subunit IIABC [Clostridium sp. MCC353]MBT9779660.1 PTS beta-glucoside transporter subunit EIIBCA [Clostridium sp. MCC353]
MSRKYEKLAGDIIKGVGGKGNVNDVYHCQTRLRFKLAAEEKADDKALEAMDGVAKVIRNAGVYQVVIGTHVADVFEEIEKLVDTGKGKGNTEAAEEKQNVVEKVIDFVAGVFQPVIPALSGAGMVKALLALLVVANVISNQSQTYYLLNLFADGVFYFLPMILAFTCAQKLKCNPILAAGVAAMMLHPNWTALVAAKEAVHFFDIIPFTLTSYGSSVIPIILIIFVQSFVEKKLKKWIPKAVELVFVPMLTFLIMGTLAFSVLGPIGAVVGNYLGTFFTFLSESAAWAPAVLVGSTLPVMVMFGLHNGVAPLGVMQMADLGYDSIFGPGCVCSNMAQATATTVVALRTKNKKTKQIAASGAITAYMGITEPALYGITLPKKYPLVSAMIGGGLGGLYAGLTHTHRFATGSSGLPAVFLYLGDDTTKYFVNIIIAILISIVSTAVITLLLSFKYEKEEADETKKGIYEAGKMTETIAETASEKTAEGTALGDTVQTAVFGFASPVKGRVRPLAEAADEAFASGALGQGVMIEPEEGVVRAPFDAKVAALFPTNHAIGLVSDSGAEIMIHVGIDTVQLDGKYFEAFTEQESRVKAGDILIKFDMEAIKAAGYQTQTMVVVTNSFDYSKIETETFEDAEDNRNIITLTK